MGTVSNWAWIQLELTQVARAPGLVPWIYVAQEKQNTDIGMIAHIPVNRLVVVAGVIFILNR